MLSIREMRLEDVEEASRVLCDVRRDAWEHYEKDYYPRRALEFDISRQSPDKLRERLGDPQRVLGRFSFVAEENGVIVGVALGDMVGESGLARLSWIGVLPSCQHRGIGKALMKRVIMHCRENGCHKIILYTLPVLVPAINLYLKSGFVPEAYFRREWWEADFIKMSLWLKKR